MVNCRSDATLLGYAYRCLIFVSFLYLISQFAEIRIEPDNNK
jgi:hypothetical protein